MAQGQQPKAKMSTAFYFAVNIFLQMYNNFYLKVSGSQVIEEELLPYLNIYLNFYTIKVNVSNKAHNLTQWKTVKKVVPPNA